MKEKINKAINNMTPDIFDSILSDCKEQKGTVIVMKEKRLSKLFVRKFAAVAAALALIVTGAVGYGVYNTTYAVDSIVSLDVNPSIEIKVNKKEKVLSVNALNEDAKIIIGKMDFKGNSLDVTVNAIIGSMLRNGYISELSNSILISVNSQNDEEALQLQKRLTDEVNELLKTDTFSGAVLSQTVDNKDDIKQLAKDYGITPGKVQLVKEIVDKDQLHTFEELAPLSINELNVIRNSKDIKLEKIESLGSASDSAYIGKDKAKAIALSHAGAKADSVAKEKIELDYEKGIMVYEYEFDSGIYEYEYDINAITGEIVKNDKEYNDDYQKQIKNETKKNENNQNEFAVKEETAQKANVNEDIGKDKAKEIALSHAGVSADGIKDYEIERDNEKGRAVYEIEFKVESVEYKYDIDASSGEIVDFEKEIDD